MKNYLTNLFNSSFYCHVMRLAIVVVCLSYSAAIAGKSTYHSKVTLYVLDSQTGRGTVYVNDSETEEGDYQKESSFKSQSIEDVSTHTYHYFARPNDGYKLEGFYKESTFQNEVTSPEQVTAQSTTQSTPTSFDRYANFQCLHQYKHTATAVAVAYEGIPVGQVSVEQGDLKEDLNIVAAWSDSNAENNEYTYESKDGDDNIIVSDVDQKWDSENQKMQLSYTFNYYAKPLSFEGEEGMEDMKFVFDGWYANEECEGEPISRSPYYAYTVTIDPSQYSDSENTTHDPSPLYAKFRLDVYYYYQGPTAGFALNSEKVGKITVTAPNGVSLATATDETTSPYTRSTSDEMIIDTDIYKVVPQSEVKYTFVYSLSDVPEDTKATFMGWSNSPYGNTYLQNEPDYTYENAYTAYATDPTNEDLIKTPAVYAVFWSYWYKDPTVLLCTASRGMGEVAVTYGDDPTVWAEEHRGTAINPENIENINDLQQGFRYSVNYYAREKHGAYFKGWAKVDNPNKLVADYTVNPYTVEYTTRSVDKDNPYMPPVVYAVFASDIDVIQQDRMICYEDVNGVTNINDANVIINFNKAPTITAKLVGEDKDYFILSDKAKVSVDSEIELSTSEGISTLVVSYRSDLPKNDAVGKEAHVLLTTNYDSGDVTRELVIKVETQPIISFLPTDGKGSYTIRHTNGNGIGYKMEQNDVENIDVVISQENMSTFELSVTDNPNDDLHFYAWELTTAEGIDYIAYTETFTYTFNQPSVIRPVFISNNLAVFTILNDPSETPYDDLQQALDDAAAMGGTQVVVYSNNGSKADAILQQGTYTIPANVTLLIPGVGPGSKFSTQNESEKGTYVYRLKTDGVIPGTPTETEVVLTLDDHLEENNEARERYRHLVVEDNTIINVENGANLYVYSLLNGVNGHCEARPCNYGQITLGENCRINVKNGAALYAFGYITGALSSRVVAESGAEVHELFQYTDTRGGAGVAHLFLNRKYYKVFPFCQYYIQNVEIPLELQSGAKEYVTTTANVLQEFVLTTTLVIPSTEPSSTSGLFRLGDGTSMIKYYNPLTDRLHITVKGSKVMNNTARFGFIEINMGDLSGVVGDKIQEAVNDRLGDSWLSGIAGAAIKALANSMVKELKNVNLRSTEYTMPLTNNMDVRFENVNMSIQNELAFLAGASITVDERSKLTLSNNAKVYIYDADENLLPATMRKNAEMTDAAWNDNAVGNGYFMSSNYALRPIYVTSKYSSPLTIRTAKTIKDAKLVVDGEVVVSKGSGFYTTAGGAQIISNKNGKITFESKLDNTETYQAKYIGGGIAGLLDGEEGVHNRATYAVTSAKLQNADGQYTSTEAATYTYDPAQGKWITGTPSADLEDGVIRVTRPDQTAVAEVKSGVSGISSAIITTEKGTPSVTDCKYEGDKLCVSISYDPCKVAGEYTGLISLKDANGETKVSQRITIIEDYTPRFSTIEEYHAPQVYLGTNISYEQLLDIVPETNNVAGILSGNYASTWTYDITGTHADEFTMVWGEGEKKLSEAKIVFKPKTAGAKEALLALTCSYKDAANVTHTTCVQVPLTAVVHSLAANTLAFADGIDFIFISDDARSLFTGGNGQEVTIEGEYASVLDIQNATTQDATVKPVSSEVADLSVTITATQAPDLENGIAGTTITKTITVTKDIVWNWKHLYFGTTNENPVTHHDNITIESIEISKNNCDYTETDGTIITVKGGDRHNVVNRLWQPEESTSGYNDHVSIAGWNEGETQVWFTVSYYDGNSTEPITHDYKSEVYRNPCYLPLSVNDNRIYEAVTWAQTGANYSTTDATVTFKPTNDAVAQWTFTFIGIPDLLTFNAQGDSNWQIEESPNGTNWTIAYTWAKIASGVPFELELQPSTRYVRITYGIGDIRGGVLSNIAISELTDVRADVEKLYMPTVTTGSTSKNVVFTYVSEDGFNLSTSDASVFTALPGNLPGWADEPYYQIKQVAVSSRAQDETSGALSVDDTDLSIPIKVFSMPQAIPIQLASDDEERYYYVTTNTYNTEWDMDNRVVRMHNNVADAAPYVVFHFADSPVPGVISFNFSETAKGTWVIDESEDATNLTPLVANTAQDLADHFVMQDFQNPGLKSDTDPKPSRYVRVKYVSDYAEIIELSNLAILPTSNVTVNPSELIVYDTQNEKLSVTANNIKQISFELPEGFAIVNENGGELNAAALSSMFIGDGTKKEDIYIKYSGTALATYGDLVISTTKDAQEADIAKKVLAVVHLTGLKKNLPVGASGIYTGTALDIAGFDKTKEAKRRPIDTQHAFASTTPLFDYVIIYGETKTTDGATTISAPTSTAGSNAQTPCYIYKKNGDNYELLSLVENANSSIKSWNGAMTVPDNHSLKVYITGFCPYASTGYSKADNGAWYFQGKSGDKIDIYLEDCYLYSRYKTKRGNSFSRSNGETYSDKVVRGSGAVLLFANQDKDNETTMDVTIHTRGTNLLKSHYGCLFESIVGRAFQASAPVQLYMLSKDHYLTSRSTLTFDDKWPTAATIGTDGEFTTTERTNGFLSLRKQVHNAPSIDMGNKHTVVNFRGGQIELENALNSSDNYESTMAISYRTGVYGPAKFRFELSCGIGTDGTEGTVKFYDGTTTVIPMTVPERYRQYYLMDKDENGKELSTTSCLRSQKNTFVYGGSHCMMRACPLPTDQGGAPTDGTNSLGLYKYTLVTEVPEGQQPDVVNETTKLATINNFPGNLVHNESGIKLSEVHKGYPKVHENDPNGRYGLESVTPKDNKLQFWIPAGYVHGVDPEVNIKNTYWKACMTSIEAKYGIYEGSIGGPTTIEFDTDGNQAEKVFNLLYCQIDQNISGVITGQNGDDYSAPVLNPAPTENADEKYMSIAPTKVGEELQNHITNLTDYNVENKVYYIVPAQADVWMAFTAPFDVANVYIMETRHEQDLHEDAKRLLGEGMEYRDAMLKSQAKHNADFAAFFGVALALESKKPFEDIFADYIGWANWKDGAARRNMYPLVHYYNTYDNEGNLETSNWDNADYYLYKNTGDWELTQQGEVGNQRFATKWEFVAPPAKGQVLLKQGETYSMLFPYCTGCLSYDENGEIIDRNFWDYWTGKFLIFESIDGSKVKDADGNIVGHHVIKGSSFVGSTPIFVEEGDDSDKTMTFKNFDYSDDGLINSLATSVGQDARIAKLNGNPTFAPMGTSDGNVLTLDESLESFGFTVPVEEDIQIIEPTQSFLYTNVVAITSSGQSLLGIGRDGTIRYGGNNSGNQNGTTGLTPTVGGGNDMFITAIDGGINIAVAAPQVVRVLSSKGSVIFAGTITTATDVLLPTSGIYIISGENEVQKILY